MEGTWSELKKRVMFWRRSSEYEKTTSEDSTVAIGNIHSGKQPVQVGNVTECALLQFSMSLGVDPEELRRNHPTSIFVKASQFHIGTQW